MLTKMDLKQIDNLISKILQNVATKDDLKKELKPIKSDIAKVRKVVDVMLSMFGRIEEHLHLPSVF